MKSFKIYVGKKIKTQNGVVKIKKLLSVETMNLDYTPSYWYHKATYETDKGKIFLYYWPYYFGRKEWITEEELQKEEEYKKWLYGKK